MKCQLLLCVLFSCTLQVFGKAAPALCNDFEQQCADKTECVYKVFLCDGDHDCKDASDEKGCEKHNCRDDTSKCADNKQCIDDTWFCDGEVDCNDKSDEKDAFCENYNCTEGFKKCADGKKCLEEKYFCNGRSDCPHKAKEMVKKVCGKNQDETQQSDQD